jgi:hypothetical protein
VTQHSNEWTGPKGKVLLDLQLSKACVSVSVTVLVPCVQWCHSFLLRKYMLYTFLSLRNSTFSRSSLDREHLRRSSNGALTTHALDSWGWGRSCFSLPSPSGRSVHMQFVPEEIEGVFKCHDLWALMGGNGHTWQTTFLIPKSYLVYLWF